MYISVWEYVKEYTISNTKDGLWNVSQDFEMVFYKLPQLLNEVGEVGT